MKRTVTFGPPVTASDDYDADFRKILDFYKTYGNPRHPGRASGPICAALGLPLQAGARSDSDSAAD